MLGKMVEAEYIYGRHRNVSFIERTVHTAGDWVRQAACGRNHQRMSLTVG